MRAPTHMAFATTCYFGLSAMTSYPVDHNQLAVLYLGSLLPDIDYASSYIGKLFFFVSDHIERNYGHRTVTHSALGCLILGVIALPILFISKEYYYILLAGYLSHIFLDMWNKTGVTFLWPSKQYSFVIFDRPYRVAVGSQLELGVFVFYLISSLFLYHYEGMGFKRIVHTATKNIRGATDDFIKYSDSNFTSLKGKYKDNATLKIFEDEFPVIAIYREGLIVKDGSKLKLVSKSDTGHLHPIKVFLEIKEPMQVMTTKIVLDSLSINDLIAAIDHEKEHYIIGQAIPGSKIEKVPDESDAFNPLYMSGERIKFQYATVEDLKFFSSVFMKRGEAIIQYRLRENEKPPTTVVNSKDRKFIHTPLKLKIESLESLKVKVGDEIIKGQVIAVDASIKNQIEKKEVELDALEADWIAEKLRIRTRKNEINGKIEYIPAGEDLEKLRQIMSAREIKKMIREREQLIEEIRLLDENLIAGKKSYNARKKKLEVDLEQLQDKMQIESPVSGKVAMINILNVLGDRVNVEILIISKDPFHKSKIVSEKELIDKKLSSKNLNFSINRKGSERIVLNKFDK